MTAKFSPAALLLATLCGLLAGRPTVARAQGASQPAHTPLLTRWAKDVSPTNALPDYPRPQMTRSRWQNLNGTWQFAAATSTDEAPPVGKTLGEKILVPFPVEATLSGVGRREANVWYRRTFTVPESWRNNDQHVLLHFDAVNYQSAVYLNGKLLGKHTGGYGAFAYDVTYGLLKTGENELIVRADNPADDRTQVLGKQRNRPGGIFYTAATGIWQTVWLEPVPRAYVESLHVTPNVDDSSVQVRIEATGASDLPITAKVTVRDGKRVVGEATGGPIRIAIKNPHLWTPTDPFLYSLHVELFQNGKKAQDSVDSYFAMRKISLGPDAKGRTTLLLNNKPLLQIGLLDQGYWPDGIYTAPTDAALKYDIEVSKKLGFNLLRKHAKVEPERWYYWTDKLGMLVWQDMPQAFWRAPTPEQKTQFNAELREMVDQKYNHPSIVTWTTFNEGWGEHDVPETVALVKSLDPSRLVNNASGWTDRGVGDMADTHAYPGPGSGAPETNRAAVNGEYGGVTMRIPGHMWTTDVFGYGSTLRDTRQVTRRYQQLQRDAYRLADEKGTSAFVYTQLTDVEQESNGLLTYDRAIVKPDEGIVLAANQGQFPPLPPDPHPPFLATAEDAPVDWRYTTDKPADGWQAATFDAAAWKIGSAGFGHGIGTIRTPWTSEDLWLRRSVTLPAIVPTKLSFLVFHDEDTEIYITGVLAGTVAGYSTGYVEVPLTDAGRAAIKPGAMNVLAAHVHNTTGAQFFDLGIVSPQPGNSNAQ